MTGPLGGLLYLENEKIRNPKGCVARAARWGWPSHTTNPPP